MPEIIRITSEALQATVRRLLPSQQGFGDDLQASNVITPIIDLTPTAEGSALPLELSSAFAHGSNTSFNVTGAADIITTTGFYRVYGVASIQVSNSVTKAAGFAINDGATDVFVYIFNTNTGIANEIVSETFDFIVYLTAGDTFKANNSSGCTTAGSFRQVADVYGNIINPSGFTFE